jgi:beta-catenin-like protein 1
MILPSESPSVDDALAHSAHSRRFIDSEADLDGAIKAMLSLAQAPTLAYPELTHSNTVSLLVGLLAHENIDIVIDVVELIHELTDEDVGNEYEDEEADENVQGALRTLVGGLVRIVIPLFSFFQKLTSLLA